MGPAYFCCATLLLSKFEGQILIICVTASTKYHSTKQFLLVSRGVFASPLDQNACKFCRNVLNLQLRTQTISFGYMLFKVSAPALIFIFILFSCRDVMRMRHGVPEIKMKDDLIISYILVEAPLAVFHYSKRQV